MSDNRPSTSPEYASAEYTLADIIAELNFKVHLEMETERKAVDLSEKLFEHLLDVNDLDLYSGRIPNHSDPEVNRFVKNLNLLFILSRTQEGGVLVLDRDIVKNIDKRVYALCMCNDGGDQLDTLCDIVNTENEARIPNSSIGVKTVQSFGGQGKSPEIF